VIQNDGNLVLYGSQFQGQIIWASNSAQLSQVKSEIRQEINKNIPISDQQRVINIQPVFS
jgi:hypothetical protein